MDEAARAEEALESAEFLTTYAPSSVLIDEFQINENISIVGKGYEEFCAIVTNWGDVQYVDTGTKIYLYLLSDTPL